MENDTQKYRKPLIFIRATLIEAVSHLHFYIKMNEKNLLNVSH